MFCSGDHCKTSILHRKAVDKALIAIQLTSLYSIAILEWNATDEVIQTWTEFKAHFTEAYDIRIFSGAGTAGTIGYHGAISIE